MCDSTRRDTNSVVFEGVCDGELATYKAKGQQRTEFRLASRYGGVTTKITVQFRGQKAHDALMLYQEGRDLAVNGRLRYRRGGRYCIVVNELDFGAGRPTTAADLAEKLDMLSEQEQAIEPTTGDIEDGVNTVEPTPDNPVVEIQSEQEPDPEPEPEEDEVPYEDEDESDEEEDELGEDGFADSVYSRS